MINGATELTKDADELYEDKQGFSFWPFEDDWLYSFDLDALNNGLSVQEILKCKKRKIEGRPYVEPPKKASSGVPLGNGRQPWKKVETSPSTYSGGSNTSSSSKPNDWDDLDDEPFPENKVQTVEFDKDKPFNGLISEQDFEDIAKYGCSYCQADVSIDDPNITVYKESKIVLCASCSRQDDGNQKIYLN
jgi:hypothetical protein